MKNLILLSLLILVSACSQLEPFVDTRREAGKETPIGQSTPNRIAVCYNPIWSSRTEAEELAKVECKKTNRTATYNETKWFSGYLVTPATAFYTCKK